MSKRLFVGNLAFAVSEEQLLEAFAEFGSSGTAIPINENGRPKGFGFVDVEDDKADAAIEAWNGKELSGRAVAVNLARPRPESGGGSFARRDRGDRGAGFDRAGERGGGSRDRGNRAGGFDRGGERRGVSHERSGVGHEGAGYDRSGERGSSGYARGERGSGGGYHRGGDRSHDRGSDRGARGGNRDRR